MRGYSPGCIYPLCCKQAKSATWIRWAQISGFDCRFEVRRAADGCSGMTLSKPADDGDDRLPHAAARRARAGREMRMVVANGDDQRPPDPSLLKLSASGPEPRADRPRRRPRRRRIERLCLLPSAPSLACPRHRRRHRQRPEPAATHRQEADAANRPTAGRLGRPAPAARIWPIGLRWTRRRRTMFPLRSLFSTPIDVRLAPKNSTTKSPHRDFPRRRRGRRAENRLCASGRCTRRPETAEFRGEN